MREQTCQQAAFQLTFVIYSNIYHDNDLEEEKDQ